MECWAESNPLGVAMAILSIIILASSLHLKEKLQLS